jgi:hypothetical protein
MTTLLLLLGMLLLAVYTAIVRRRAGLRYSEAVHLSPAGLRQRVRLIPWWADTLLALGLLCGSWGCWRLYGL